MNVEVTIVPGMALDEATARELSRAAKNAVTWTEKRNQLIRDALVAGGGVREVARIVDLAPATVLNIQKPKSRVAAVAEPEVQRCACEDPDWYHDGFVAQVDGRLCRRCRGRENRG